MTTPEPSQAFDWKGLFEAVERLKKADRIKRNVTVHHPDCKAILTGDPGLCNCGGWAYPA